MKSSLRFFPIILLLVGQLTFAQTGLTVSPPRNYFTSAPGQSARQKVIVTNPSKETPLTLTVSLSDWQYNGNGNNVIEDAGTFANSCAAWTTIQPQSYFTLAPGQSKELEVVITPPAVKTDNLNVHTALLFITQTNPIDSFNDQGALVKVTLRSGVKIYHRYDTPEKPEIEFTNYQYEKTLKNLLLVLENKGNTWTDGTLTTELVNQNDGTTYKLEDQILYTLPGDERIVHIALPATLKAGKYIATSSFSYGADDIIKMAELTFAHE